MAVVLDPDSPKPKLGLGNDDALGMDTTAAAGPPNTNPEAGRGVDENEIFVVAESTDVFVIDAAGTVPKAGAGTLVSDLVVEPETGGANANGFTLKSYLGNSFGADGAGSLNFKGVNEDEKALVVAIGVVVVAFKDLLASVLEVINPELGSSVVPTDKAGAADAANGLTIAGLEMTSSVAFVVVTILLGVLKMDEDTGTDAGRVKIPVDVPVAVVLVLLPNVAGTGAVNTNGAMEDVDVFDDVRLSVLTADADARVVEIASLVLLTMLRTSSAAAESLGAGSTTDLSGSVISTTDTVAIIGDSTEVLTRAFLFGSSSSSS